MLSEMFPHVVVDEARAWLIDSEHLELDAFEARVLPGYVLHEVMGHLHRANEFFTKGGLGIGHPERILLSDELLSLGAELRLEESG